MGYFESQTVEIEVNGEKIRVFKLEADAIKAKLAKEKKAFKKAE